VIKDFHEPVRAIQAELVSLVGGCLCGTVQYTVADEFEYALICHCSQCRRATGSAFKPFGGIRKDKLALVAGEDAVLRYGGEAAHDVHCGRCGSLLYSWFRDTPYVHVTYGTLHDNPALKPTAHICVGSKAPWDVIFDDLPQHDALP
jgi:hypothetical protein